MTDTQILSEMIADAALETITPRAYGQSEQNLKYVVDLREPKEPDSMVTIENMPEDALVIKADVFHSPDSVFKGSKGECKRADYVIISETKKRIIYIEMKRTSDEWNKIVKQLMGAQCFISYCQEIGRAFWEDRDFLCKYENRFINIRHTGSVKRKPTYETPCTGLHDVPDNAMKVSYAKSIQFNRIAT